MSFFLSMFKSNLRSRLTGWRTWLLLLLLPAITFGAKALLPAEAVSTPVQVGVVLPEEGGGDFWTRLEARSGLVVTFHRADLDQAEQQVAAGRWDCALVLPEDFRERLSRRDTDRIFRLLIGPGSTVYPLVRETAASCLAEEISPGMAEDYLLDSGIVTEERIGSVRSRLEEVLLDQDRVLVSMETADGRPLDPLSLADSGISGLLAGLTAILLTIWALLTAMENLAQQLEGGEPLLRPELLAAALPKQLLASLFLLIL